MQGKKWNETFFNWKVNHERYFIDEYDQKLSTCREYQHALRNTEEFPGMLRPPRNGIVLVDTHDKNFKISTNLGGFVSR